MNFIDAVGDWKSNDEWWYADKEAAWKFFFAAGKESSQAVISAQCVKMSQYESIIFELRAQLAAQEECEFQRNAHKQAEELMLEQSNQLAAEQLNNKRLRDALQEYIDEHEECQDADDWMAMMCSVEAHHAADEALSQPSDTSALDAYVAEKVKEAGKFDMWKINPYTKVLETSIKQLTKQRDLAVEALEKIAKKCNLDMHGDDGLLGGYAYGIWNTANSTLSTIKESEK